jgi:hypothetical protein
VKRKVGKLANGKEGGSKHVVALKNVGVHTFYQNGMPKNGTSFL